MGAIGRTATVATNLPAHCGGRPIQSPGNLSKRRIGKSEAIPREMSSRSASVSASRERRRAAGGMPPRGNNTERMQLCGLSKARPISCSDCPAFHRFQTSRFSIAIVVLASCQHHLYTAGFHQMVLHRPVECTALSFFSVGLRLLLVNLG
jgi:hypothetical protein